MDAKSQPRQNYYRILNLAPTASIDEIRKAISRELRLWSNRTNAPDIARRQEAERMVRILGDAESILLNNDKRKAYDREVSSLPTEQRDFTDAELGDESDLVAEAWQLLSNGEIPDALFVATKATERDGNNPWAWAVLAQAKFRWGETEDAIYEYKRAIRLKPNEASYYFDLGSVYESLDRSSDALQQYQRAAQAEPKTTMYRAAVGVMLLKTDQIHKGTATLERCLEEEPENASYQWFLALAYTNDAHRDWICVPPGDGRGIPAGYYATKKEHVTRAQSLIAKAERMKFNDPELSKHIREVHADIDKMMERRFFGSIVTPIVGGLIWAYLFYGVGLLLAPLYFWVSRPPQYALNARALAGEGGPATAMQWETGTGFVENVTGGLFTAALWGLFLPIMVVWNFVKFRTGENDLGEFEFSQSTTGRRVPETTTPNETTITGSAATAEPPSAAKGPSGAASAVDPPEAGHTPTDPSAQVALPAIGAKPSVQDADLRTGQSFSLDRHAPLETEAGASSTAFAFPDAPRKLVTLLATAEGQRNALLACVILLALAGIGYWAFLGRTPAVTTANDGAPAESSGPPVTVYATRSTFVRNVPTTIGSQVIAGLSRGDMLNGVWVIGSDGLHQWLKLSSGAYVGDFVSSINLSALQPPALARPINQNMRLQKWDILLSAPNAMAASLDPLAAGSVVHVSGEVEGGWLEIVRKGGGVGYLPLQDFDIVQPALTTSPPDISSTRAPPSFAPISTGSENTPGATPDSAPELARQLYNKGVDYLDNKEYELSAEEFRQVIGLAHMYGPSTYYASSLMMAGADFERLGRFEDAFQFYTEGVKNIPTVPPFLRDRCWVRLELGRDLDAALDDCNRFVQSNPAGIDHFNMLRLRGFVYLKIGRINDAIADFSAALGGSPRLLGPFWTKTINGQSLFGRGVAKLRNGDLTAGNDDIRMAESLDPEVASTIAKIGIVP